MAPVFQTVSEDWDLVQDVVGCLILLNFTLATVVDYKEPDCSSIYSSAVPSVGPSVFMFLPQVQVKPGLIFNCILLSLP